MSCPPLQRLPHLAPTVAGSVRAAFAAAVARAFPELTAPAPAVGGDGAPASGGPAGGGGGAVDPAVGPSNPRFGDFQCNCAMNIFKANKSLLGVKSPKEVAERINEKLEKALFSETVVAPQGFITVRLADEALLDFLVQSKGGAGGAPTADGGAAAAAAVGGGAVAGGKDGLPSGGAGGASASGKSLPSTVVVDYSSPNIAKEMHVGHLRSTIIGEVICRLLEFLGLRVLRVNHVGDWGTQFGMLIEHLREIHPDFMTSPPELTDLTKFYREAKLRFDSDAEFKKRSQLMVPRLQSGDPEARAAWALICEISRRDFRRLYDRFNLSDVLIERGESFYNDLIPGVVKQFEDKGFVTDSDGAKTIFVKDDPVPLMAVKADGGYGYDSTDIACAYHRLVLEKHMWNIYVTDIGQEQHFFKLFKAAEMIGYIDRAVNGCTHVGFGLVQGEDGKKFKTRSGDVVKLTDLLDEAAQRALTELKNRQNEKIAAAAAANEDADPVETLSEEEMQATAEKIGLAAVRYFDLKQNRLTNYRFSFDKMLDPKGNTAVYLLYAYARICAIFRKAGQDFSSLNMKAAVKNEVTLTAPAERQLLLQLLKFDDIINACVDDLHVHRIAEYLFDVSNTFTSFYQTCKIVGEPQQRSRLILCEATRRYMKVAFFFLGIEPLDRI